MKNRNLFNRPLLWTKVNTKMGIRKNWSRGYGGKKLEVKTGDVLVYADGTIDNNPLFWDEKSAKKTSARHDETMLFRKRK